MNSTFGWGVYSDKESESSLGVAPAKTGKALAISYNLGSGAWTGARNDTSIDISKFGGIRFMCRADGNRNTLEVKFEDADGTNYGKYISIDNNSDAWKTVEIPFTSLQYWWGDNDELDLTQIKLNFVVSKKKEGDQGGKGTVFIGSIQAFGSGKKTVLKTADLEPDENNSKQDPNSAAAESVIDDMKSAPAGWLVEKDNGASAALGSARGQRGKALELSYNMGGGQWAGIRKKIKGNISGYKGIRLSLRGEGASNSVEVKLENPDYSNFGKLLSMKSNSGSWTTVEVPFTDLSYLWGDVQELNLKRTSLHVTVVARDSDDGGIGKLIIDGIELYK